MPRDAIAKLLAEVGGGGEYTGTEYHTTASNEETLVTAEINEKCQLLLLFGDALNQFYVDTIRAFIPQLSASNREVTTFTMHWHVVSSTRCRAAFDLWKRGYYFESATLSRTLWETALTLAGLEKGIVTIEELFGGRIVEGIKQDPKKFIQAVRNADKKVQDKLLWGNPALTQDGKNALEVVMQLMNQSTHKSNLALIANINRQRQNQSIPIFVRYDFVYVTMTWNVFFMATRSLMTTLKYVDELHPANTASWQSRYDMLLAVFQEISNDHLPPDVKEFGKVIDQVFMK